MENNNSFWKTERGKALIKLIAWFIFIAALIVFVFVSDRDYSNVVDEPSNPTENTDNNSEETYTFTLFGDMITKLLEGNYEYSYNIVSNSVTYVFNGIQCNNANLGYKETRDGVIKYYIDENNTYQVILDEYLPITNLYEGIDINFLDLDILFNNLNEYLYTVEKNADTRTVTYNKEGYQVVVTTDLENITNINIVSDLGVYNLDFTVIDTCDLGVLSE